MSSLMNAGLLVPLFVIGAVLSFLFGARTLFAGAPRDDRTYLDPVPSGLRLLWPLVNLLERQVGRWAPKSYRSKLAARFSLAGLQYLFTPEQFIALQTLSALFFAFAAGVLSSFMEASSFSWITAGALCGFFFPFMKIKDYRKKRVALLLKDLPTTMDFLVLGVEAGLNLSGAIAQAIEKGPAGPLQQEFARVLRDVRAGIPKSEALTALSERVHVNEITTLVNAVVQSERLGSNLAPTLRQQAMQRRQERFLRAEKLAFEAPVKLMGPLVIFIFPTTFAVLGWVMYQKYLQAGL